MAQARQPGHTVDSGAEAQEKYVEADILKHVVEFQLVTSPRLKRVSCVCHSCGGWSLKRLIAQGKDTRMVKTKLGDGYSALHCLLCLL